MNNQPKQDDLDEIDYSITTRSYRDLSEVQLTDMRLKLTDKAKHQIQAKIDAAVAEAVSDIRKWVEYNKHDMGEMGEFIRTQYVYNKLDELTAPKPGEEKPE